METIFSSGVYVLRCRRRTWDKSFKTTNGSSGVASRTDSIGTTVTNSRVSGTILTVTTASAASLFSLYWKIAPAVYGLAATNSWTDLTQSQKHSLDTNS